MTPLARRVACLLVFTPGLASSGCGGGDPEPAVQVVEAFAVRGAGFAPGALYATVHNASATADTLTAVDVAGAAHVALHESVNAAGGVTTMEAAGAILVPPRGILVLAPGHAHGMIDGLPAAAMRGDTLAATFHFSRAGAVVTRAEVIDYADVGARVKPGAR